MNLSDLKDAAMAGSSSCEYRLVSVAEAVQQVVAGIWDRPAFQRVFMWKPWQVCEIADSVWRDFSIGPLLLWPDPGGDNGGRSRWWIADGQHRLISLCMLFGERPVWWRDGRASRSGAVPTYNICFDLQATESPFFVCKRAAPGAPLARRFVPLSMLCKIDAASASGQEMLARITTEARQAGYAMAASAAELSARLARVCQIRERPVLATIVHRESRDEVIEIFNRLNGGGLRFRRLLLQLLSARLRW